MNEIEVTPTMVEAGAMELYHLAARGQSWWSASFELRCEFTGYSKQILEAAAGAEVAARAKAPRVLPELEPVTQTGRD
jgi:hypothetical protein